MTNSYKQQLINQYKKAMGIHRFNPENISDLREFEEWLKSLKDRNEVYIALLKDNNIKLGNDFSTAEVFKGGLDMATRKVKTKIISEYIDGKDNEAFIKGNFMVFNGKPIVFTSEDGITTFKNLEGINTFMTQNPYSPNDIKGWDAMHNNTKNIIVGIHGSKQDKDKKEKEKLLINLKEQLYTHIIDEYYEANGNYYYFVASDQTKIK